MFGLALIVLISIIIKYGTDTEINNFKTTQSKTPDTSTITKYTHTHTHTHTHTQTPPLFLFL